MSDDKKKKPSREQDLNLDAEYQELEKAGKKGLFGRMSSGFNDKLQQGRGPERQRDAVRETSGAPNVTADDIAIRRARTTPAAKMIIPEGAILEGSLTGGSETEISGRVEGNITVDGKLYLGKAALVSGDIRAGMCKIDGLVEGKVECSEILDLGKTGRLNADVIGKQINIAGQVYGNVMSSGVLNLAAGSLIQGDVKARRMNMEEGAKLNGRCIMRSPGQQNNEVK